MTPQTNDTPGLKIIIDLIKNGSPSNQIDAMNVLVNQIVPKMDTRIHSLTQQLEEAKSALEKFGLLLNSPATCICETPAVNGAKSWFCQQHGTITIMKPSYAVLEKFYEASQAQLSEAVEALEKISHADDENHYGEEGLALMVCVETSKSALFRLKSGGGGS